VTKPSDSGWLKYLKSWPLLIAAVIAIAFGVGLASSDQQRAYGAVTLLTVGTLLLGVWIALLVTHGHTGEDDKGENDK
jgi:FtsH-binding integral membrane protein